MSINISCDELTFWNVILKKKLINNLKHDIPHWKPRESIYYLCNNIIYSIYNIYIFVVCTELYKMNTEHCNY